MFNQGVGRLYQQTGIDTHANVGFAKLYLDKTSLTAADFMNDKVLPFYDEQGINILRILTDRGHLDTYNNDRTNQGRYCKGRTPAETLRDGLELYQRYVFENENDLEERRALK